MKLHDLICVNCRKVYRDSGIHRVCVECSSPLMVSYNYEDIRGLLNIKEVEKRPPSVWKYFELLPISKGFEAVSLGEGSTFLHRCTRLAEALGVKRLYIKNETTNPTGSFIDRGTAVVVTRAKEAKIRSLSCAPTGNLGASLAAYAANAGIRCSIFIGPDVELGKLYQMIAYGAEVSLSIRLEEALSKAEETGGYLVTPADPYLLEGEKTIGFEVAEQLSWRNPDRIIVPMGNGGMLSMVWKAFNELEEIDFIEEASVKMVGVQADGCAPIVRAFKNNVLNVGPTESVRTIATDIAVEKPTHGAAALKAMKDSCGTAVSVSENEILEAIAKLAKTEGIFAEPAAASTVAALKKLLDSGEVERSDEVVCVITGAGLKDPSTARRFTERFRKIRRLIAKREERRLTYKLGPTKLRILEAFLAGSLHGYGVWRKLKQQHNIDMKIVSVYQHLQELEMLGLVSRSKVEKIGGKPSRQYYTLTKEGTRILENIDRIWGKRLKEIHSDR